MSDEKTPEMEDIKIRLGDEIPVEDETPAYKAGKEPVDVVEELRNLGRQFGETVRSAWYSEERLRFETEIREGFESFAQEADKAFREVKESDVTKKAQAEAEELKTKVEASEVTRSAQAGFAEGLRWFSKELSKLSDQFTPAEKAPPDEETDA